MSGAENIHRGDRRISAGNFNRVVELANRNLKTQFSSDFVVSNDGTGLHVGLKPGIKDHPFRIRRKGGTSVIVSSGPIEHNGIHLSTSQTTLTGLSTSGTRYAVFFDTSSATYNPMIQPEGATVGSSAGGIGSPDTQWDGTRQLIGYVTVGPGIITRIDQKLDDTVERWMTVLDGEVMNSSASAVIKTLGRRTDNDIHKGEAGMWGAEGIGSSEYGVPYLKKIAGQGDLAWGVFDADEGGDGVGSQKSLERRGGLFQDWTFDDPPSSVVPDNENDKIYIRDNTGPTKVYADFDDFADAIEGLLSIDWNQIINIVTSDLPHTDLDFGGGSSGAAGSNPDHDARYWIAGRSYGDNYGNSIGNGNGSAAVIHLENRQLLNGVWKVTDATDVNPGTPGSAAFQISGGLDVVKSAQFDRIYIHDRTANSWHATEHVIDVLGAVGHLAGSTYSIEAVGAFTAEGATATLKGTAGVATVISTSDVQLEPQKNLEINGVPGATINDVTALAAKGILVNTAGWSVIGIRVIPSGGGQPFNMNVLGRVT